MTEQEIQENKQRIVTLLRSTRREGIENVLEYLEKHDFYHVPSSLHRHHNWIGGLAQHALGVYDRLKTTARDLPEDSVIITSLLHDICKARKHYRDHHGNWKERPQSDFHYKGHGHRSLKLLENTCGLHLTKEERGAIRWHMGGYNINNNQLRNFFANKNNTLWRLLLNADRYNASHAEPQKQ